MLALLVVLTILSGFSLMIGKREEKRK